PLTFTVGAGQMIPGFDSAVADMKLGETKTVTISPEDAYGESDPEMIIDIPTALDRIMYLDRQFSISPSDFDNAFAKEAVPDDIVGDMFPWNFKVITVSDDNITLEYMMEIGDIFVMPQTAWNSTVIEINKTTITVMQNPVDGQVIQTLFGPASITLEDDRITLMIDIEIGKQIITPSGQGGTVVSVNEDSITLDINPAMAGKTLIFEITVENVTKAVTE
ncbi:MAG: FKBP-type peptidyl-prolyl cis-trans isomerase, partial [archaeon]|nr:FKBP-type peptidyl-prolyl cis-trans isomerase [archaeon]